MSETVYYKGKLTEIKPNINENLKQLAARLLSENNIIMKDYYNGDYLECLLEHGYYDFVLIKDKLYSVDKTRYEDSEDIFEASLNKDNTIDFIVKYYNGGCGFDEAIREAVVSIS